MNQVYLEQLTHHEKSTCLNVSVVRKLSIILMIAAPFPYEILSNISWISSGCFTGIEIGWELSKASILNSKLVSFYVDKQ